jgi:hypothetical protein
MTKQNKQQASGKGFNRTKIRNKKIADLCAQLMSGDRVLILKSALTGDGNNVAYIKNLIDTSENLQAYHSHLNSEQIAFLGIRRQFEQFKGYLSVMPVKCHETLKELSIGKPLTEQERHSQLIFNWFSSSATKKYPKPNRPIVGQEYTLQQIFEYLQDNCIVGEQFPVLAYYPPESGFPCLLFEVDAILCVVNKSTAIKDMPVVISGQNFCTKN